MRKPAILVALSVLGLLFLALLRTDTAYWLVLAFSVLCRNPFEMYSVPVAGGDVRFGAHESGQKRIELSVDSFLTRERRLTLTISKTGLRWLLKGPDGKSLEGGECSDTDPMQGISLQNCWFNLTSEHKTGLYRLELSNADSPVPAVASLRYWKKSFQIGIKREMGDDWPKSWVNVDRPREDRDWPYAGSEWTSRFEVEGEAPAGELQVESEVEYLPGIPSSVGEQTRVEKFRNVIQGKHGEVRIVPSARGALRITHRLSSASDAGWSAIGSSDWIPAGGRVAYLSDVRVRPEIGLEMDLDVKVGGHYQLGAEFSNEYGGPLPWEQAFELKPGKQRVQVPIPARKLKAMAFGRQMAVHPFARISGLASPGIVEVSASAKGPLALDIANWKIEADPTLGSITARPVKLGDKVGADLLEVNWEMETNGGYCQVLGRLISLQTGKRIEVVARGSRERGFARLRVELAFPGTAFAGPGDGRWDFEGLQVCGKDKYPALAKDWKAAYRTHIDVNAANFSIPSIEQNFEVRENVGYVPFDFVQMKRLPNRFSVPVYAKRPFDPSTQLRVGAAPKGFGVSASQLRPFLSVDVPVGEVWIQVIHLGGESPLSTRYFPIHLESKGYKQEMFVVCPPGLFLGLRQGNLARSY